MEKRQGQELVQSQVNNSGAYRVFNIVFAVLFGGIALLVVFRNPGAPFAASWLWLLAAALAGAGLALLLSRLFSALPDFAPRAEGGAVAALLAGFVVLQLVVGGGLLAEPAAGTDYGEVYHSARAYVMDGVLPGDYFLYFQSNVGLYALFCGLFSLLKAMGVANFMPALMGLNVLAVTGSVALMYLCGRRIFGVKKAVFSLCAAFFVLPLLLAGPVATVHTLTLPVPVALLLLWMKVRSSWRAGQGKRAFAQFCLLSAMAGLGALLKPTVLVMWIAAGLDLLLLLCGRRRLRMLLAGLAVVLALAVGGWVLLWAAAPLPAYDADGGLPLGQWVMMGLTGRGGFNASDMELTLQVEGGAARAAFVNAEIAMRLRDLFPLGIFSLLGDKLAYTFGDGVLGITAQLDAASGGEGWREVFLPSGGGYAPAAYLSFAVLAAMLAWMAVAAAKANFRKNNALTAARMGLFGLVLFLLLWKTEPGEIINFLPVMLLCALEASPPPRRSRRQIQRMVQHELYYDEAELDENGEPLEWRQGGEGQPEQAEMWEETYEAAPPLREEEPSPVVPAALGGEMISLGEWAQRGERPQADAAPLGGGEAERWQQQGFSEEDAVWEYAEEPAVGSEEGEPAGEAEEWRWPHWQDGEAATGAAAAEDALPRQPQEPLDRAMPPQAQTAPEWARDAWQEGRETEEPAAETEAWAAVARQPQPALPRALPVQAPLAGEEAEYPQEDARGEEGESAAVPGGFVAGGVAAAANFAGEADTFWVQEAATEGWAAGEAADAEPADAPETAGEAADAELADAPETTGEAAGPGGVWDTVRQEEPAVEETAGPVSFAQAGFRGQAEETGVSGEMFWEEWREPADAQGVPVGGALPPEAGTEDEAPVEGMPEPGTGEAGVPFPAQAEPEEGQEEWPGPAEEEAGAAGAEMPAAENAGAEGADAATQLTDENDDIPPEESGAAAATQWADETDTVPPEESGAAAGAFGLSRQLPQQASYQPSWLRIRPPSSRAQRTGTIQPLGDAQPPLGRTLPLQEGDGEQPPEGGAVKAAEIPAAVMLPEMDGGEQPPEKNAAEPEGIPAAVAPGEEPGPGMILPERLREPEIGAEPEVPPAPVGQAVVEVQFLPCKGAPAEDAGRADGGYAEEAVTAPEGDMLAEMDMSAEGDVPADGDAPAGGDMSAEGDVPADGDASADGDAPAGGDMSAEGDVPADGDAPTEGDMSAEGDAPAEAWQEPDTLEDIWSVLLPPEVGLYHRITEEETAQAEDFVASGVDEAEEPRISFETEYLDDYADAPQTPPSQAADAAPRGAWVTEDARNVESPSEAEQMPAHSLAVPVAEQAPGGETDTGLWVDGPVVWSVNEAEYAMEELTAVMDEMAARLERPLPDALPDADVRQETELGVEPETEGWDEMAAWLEAPLPEEGAEPETKPDAETETEGRDEMTAWPEGPLPAAEPDIPAEGEGWGPASEGSWAAAEAVQAPAEEEDVIFPPLWESLQEWGTAEKPQEPEEGQEAREEPEEGQEEQEVQEEQEPQEPQAPPALSVAYLLEMATREQEAAENRRPAAPAPVVPWPPLPGVANPVWPNRPFPEAAALPRGAGDAAPLHAPPAGPAGDAPAPIVPRLSDIDRLLFELEIDEAARNRARSKLWDIKTPLEREKQLGAEGQNPAPVWENP